jgi:hypothetical protein
VVSRAATFSKPYTYSALTLLHMYCIGKIRRKNNRRNDDKK